MREIKFRAWNKISKKMYTMYGFTLNIHGEIVAQNENEVMQYTGLKDKNGKEIYEGDIVLCENRIIRKLFKIGFDNSVFTAKGIDSNSNTYLYLLNSLNELKVIGNIYENPELLTD